MSSEDSSRGGPSSEPAREAWLLMSDLVLDNARRRQVSKSLGLSFSRTRALRRLASHPMTMRELADALGIDPANTTGLVDDLESLGLARRRAHPTDRRAKLVEATRKGKSMARRADEMLATPPAELAQLSTADLETLRRILAKAAVRGPR